MVVLLLSAAGGFITALISGLITKTPTPFVASVIIPTLSVASLIFTAILWSDNRTSTNRSDKVCLKCNTVSLGLTKSRMAEEDKKTELDRAKALVASRKAMFFMSRG